MRKEVSEALACVCVIHAESVYEKGGRQSLRLCVCVSHMQCQCMRKEVGKRSLGLCVCVCVCVCGTLASAGPEPSLENSLRAARRCQHHPHTKETTSDPMCKVYH
jgi:hypothetical protein